MKIRFSMPDDKKWFLGGGYGGGNSGSGWSGPPGTGNYGGSYNTSGGGSQDWWGN